MLSCTCAAFGRVRRYVLLPNKLPPKRFEAHLEVHAGSVDERTDEQARRGRGGGHAAGVGVGVVRGL